VHFVDFDLELHWQWSVTRYPYGRHILKSHRILGIWRVYGMACQKKQAEDFHPEADGDEGETVFGRVLSETFRDAANGRRRVELRQLQAALLARGWHP